MSVDPAIAAMLTQAKSRNAGSIWDVSIETMRTGYRERYRERSAVPRAAVHRRSIAVETGSGSIPVAIYTPEGSSHPLPLMVYFHGGGFVLGDDAAYERQTSNLAIECECAVAFVDYRKAPEFKFPTAVDDAIAATRHLVRIRGDLGFDEARLALTGDSAGANLAINVASTEIGAIVDLLCLLYPVVNLRPYVGLGNPSISDKTFSTGYGLDFDHMRFFAHQYLPNPMAAADVRASPIVEARFQRQPPTLVFSARNDVLFDQAKDFVDLAHQCGTGVTHIVFEEMIHNFMGHVNVSSLAAQYFGKVCENIRFHIHDNEALRRLERFSD